ncbi:MAG: lysophospholipid acyltransferase family protein [Pseudomonadota bacterium]
MQHLSIQQKISILNLFDNPSALTRLGTWLMDNVMGIAKMDALYKLHSMQGLDKEAFVDRFIEILSIELSGLDELQKKIPTEGPVVVASNHPFGGMEGVILARAIGEVRPDIKVLANKSLRIFDEIKDYFIFTNPLAKKDPANAPSLRHCIRHIDEGKCLLLFPAGRVSHLDNGDNRTVENKWDKLVTKLATRNHAHFVPIFVDGRNSDWFYRVERIYFKLRMFLLGRELLNKKNFHFSVNAGYPVSLSKLDFDSLNEGAKLCRSLSYLHSNEWQFDWPADTVIEHKPLLSPIDKGLIQQEFEALPQEQFLTSHREFDVYFGYQHQMPSIVTEIARLRELVFRMHNEGSGEPVDTDDFDATYTHLFIIDRVKLKIIGAYRMGQTDILIERQGIDGLYLHKMFDFKPTFVNRQESCLEMGRSFLIPEYQSSFHGLLLLWRGIGAFVKKFPKYRTLYGTVSISKLYQPKSVRLIQEVLIEHQSEPSVVPRNPFDFELHPELKSFCDKSHSRRYLSALIGTLEEDGKDIPVLAKQYEKMGAKFHALGIDRSFNFTPGLLLTVEMPKAPAKLLNLYLCDGWEDYVNHKTT